jgi:3',5'-cyclic AMP phosphodiesterase CpdA
METLMIVKSRCTPTFTQTLKSSYPKKLVHNVACPFWGTGPDGQGRNMTGKILEKVRANIMDEKVTPEHSEEEDSVDVLLIGHSHLKNFDTRRIRGVQIEKVTAHNIEEAHTVLNQMDSLPPKTILHLITNDIKSLPVEMTVHNMKNLGRSNTH